MGFYKTMDVSEHTSLTWTSASLNQPGESLADSLSCKALHLDVEELSEVAEPFNHLGGHTAVKLDSEQENSRRRSEQEPGGSYIKMNTFT